MVYACVYYVKTFKGFSNGFLVALRSFGVVFFKKYLLRKGIKTLDKGWVCLWRPANIKLIACFHFLYKIEKKTKTEIYFICVPGFACVYLCVCLSKLLHNVGKTNVWKRYAFYKKSIWSLSFAPGAKNVPQFIREAFLFNNSNHIVLKTKLNSHSLYEIYIAFAWQLLINHFKKIVRFVKKMFLFVVTFTTISSFVDDPLEKNLFYYFQLLNNFIIKQQSNQQQ